MQMGNLGGYQSMVTLVKSLGGPAKAVTLGIAVVGAAGYGVIRLAEAGGKKLVNASKNTLANRRAGSRLIGQSFIVHTDGADDSGLEFNVGSEYIVLEHDDDALLIELIGAQDNPHAVSGAFLSTISDFPISRSDGSS